MGPFELAQRLGRRSRKPPEKPREPPLVQTCCPSKVPHHEVCCQPWTGSFPLHNPVSPNHRTVKPQGQHRFRCPLSAKNLCQVHLPTSSVTVVLTVPSPSTLPVSGWLVFVYWPLSAWWRIVLPPRNCVKQGGLRQPQFLALFAVAFGKLEPCGSGFAFRQTRCFVFLSRQAPVSVARERVKTFLSVFGLFILLRSCVRRAGGRQFDAGGGG